MTTPVRTRPGRAELLNPVDDYAHRVVSGEIPAGKYHRLACKRHLDDRAKEASDPSYPFRFVWEEYETYKSADGTPKRRLKQCAVRFLQFARRMRHYKGKQFRGRPFEPSPFQVFRLGSIFGWRRKDTGGRRFTTAYNELPRKNGKSFEAGIVAIYVTFFEGEQGAEGYVVATKREQANIVFNVSRVIVLRSRDGSRVLSRIRVGKHALYMESTESTLQPLGKDSDTTDGLNPNLIVVDEMHAMKDRGLIDVMETATGSREDPLNFQITTAGDDLVSPCGDQHDYATKILDGVLNDDATEAFFAFIAHADLDDDAFEESTWRKANPNYGISVDPVDMRKLALKAKNMPSAAAQFKQKRLNLWVNTIAPWLSLEGWRAGQRTPSVDQLREMLKKRRCFAGVDLSSKVDLAAVTLVFPPWDADPIWRLLLYALTPADTLLERSRRDRAPYPFWKERGYLDTNPGNRIDQDRLREFLQTAATEYELESIGVDPWNSGNLVTDLGNDGFDVVEIPQTLQQMSAPCKEFEADVLDGRVDCGSNPLMAWCVSNVVVIPDNKDNIYPSKKRSRGRIDPVIAALMGRKLATAGPAEPEKKFQMLILGK